MFCFYNFLIYGSNLITYMTKICKHQLAYRPKNLFLLFYRRFYANLFHIFVIYLAISEYSNLHATALQQANKTAKLESDIAQLKTETNNLKNRSTNPGTVV